jgi:hypothetical protein
MTDLEKKWRQTGLLDIIEGPSAQILAEDLQKCIDHLLLLREKEGHENVEEVAGFSLPAIIRIFRLKNIQRLDMPKFIQDLRSWINSRQDLRKQLLNNFYNGMAADAELCRLFCEEYTQ